MDDPLIQALAIAIAGIGGGTLLSLTLAHPRETWRGLARVYDWLREKPPRYWQDSR